MTISEILKRPRQLQRALAAADAETAAQLRGEQKAFRINILLLLPKLDDERERTAIRYYFAGCYSLADTAYVMGLSIPAVIVLLYRAKKHLEQS